MIKLEAKNKSTILGEVQPQEFELAAKMIHGLLYLILQMSSTIGDVVVEEHEVFYLQVALLRCQ